MEPKSDVGIKLSQPFFDAETASDKDLYFSSSFPLLKEEKTGVFNINSLPHSGGLVSVYQHKLGYFPFFVIQDDQGKMRLGTEWQVDNFALYFLDSSSLFPPTGGTGNFRWTIYRLDIFDPFEASDKEDGAVSSTVYDPNFGFKFAKAGASIDSDDLRDFTLHSRGRSPLLNVVNVKDWQQGAASESHAYTSTLPYNPLAFAFVQQRGVPRAYNMQNGGQATPRLTRADKTITVNSAGNSTQRSSIMTFKDPFLSPNVIQVTY